MLRTSIQSINLPGCLTSKFDCQEGEHYIKDGSVNVGVFTENGSLTHWNILADGVSGRVKADGSKVYYLKDHLGSTRAVINETGGIQESHDYYPFGLEMPGRRTVSEPPLTKELFTGKERDAETGLDYFGARYYDADIGRWLGVDPLAEKFPGWSPYNYTLNNPINNFDPDGREVVFSDSAKAASAATALNKVNEGADITVETVTKKHSFLGLFSWTSKSYKLSTSSSTFDWGQNKYTSALYDAINSKEIVFNVNLVDGKTRIGTITLYDLGRGFTKSYKGGGDILISNTGNRVGEPIGVVFMHELVAHGTWAGGEDSHDINRFYQKKLGYEREAYGITHRGYHKVIGWKRTGLYNSTPKTWPFIKPRHR